MGASGISQLLGAAKLQSAPSADDNSRLVTACEPMLHTF